MREKLSAVLEPLSTVDANNDHFTKTGSGQTQGTLRGKRRFLAGNPREGNRLPWAREPNGQVETDLQPEVREHNIIYVICYYMLLLFISLLLAIIITYNILLYVIIICEQSTTLCVGL